jgi:hypothetical protein
MTIEGCIRQSTQNRLPTFKLTLLLGGEQVYGMSVVRRGDSVRILTFGGEIPIYSFKMDQNLMGLLKRDMEEWYE